MKFYGTGYKEGGVYTAIHTFEHPHTHSNISLVGMSHRAKREYFNRIEAFVNAREEIGAITHYEQSDAPDSEVLSFHEGWVQNLARRWQEMRIVQRSTEEDEDGNVHQRVINFTRPIEIHDMNTVDVFKSMGRPLASRFVRRFEEQERLDDDNNTFADEVMVRMTHRTLVHKRNKVALAAIDRALATDPSTSLTLLWGADHLPGLSHGLLKRQYEHRNTQWVLLEPRK